MIVVSCSDFSSVRLLLVAWLTSELSCFVAAQNQNYFGVAYSPYVRKGGSPWDMAPLEDITQMLKIVSKYHNSVSTYSMGVNRKLINLIKNFYTCVHTS